MKNKETWYTNQIYKDQFKTTRDKFLEKQEEYVNYIKINVTQNIDTNNIILFRDTNPKIVIIYINKYLYKAELFITIQNKIYKLIGSIISYYPSLADGNVENDTARSRGHAICGFICDEKYYVYDSWNYLAQTNWPAGDLSGYYEILDDKIFPRCNYFKINTLIYMLNDT